MLNITFSLQPGSKTPLYHQLYQALAGQIRAGAIPTGARLPGKRALAQELGLSVNTVDTAYQMLAAEGYVESRPRSGFAVLPYEEASFAPAAGHAPAPAEPDIPQWAFDLSTRGVDTDLFPFRAWGRIQKELLYDSPQLLHHGPAQGDAELRAALADYLAAYRGVRCTADQIVVGAGAEYLLGLLAPLLAGVAAVEDPCYPRARTIFENSGLPCRLIPVDEGGLSVQALAQTDANVCYVTPSHQFPTGVTMPAPRRAALLRWAARQPGQRFIIEDDYDSEFRFDIRPLPSLQGMAGGDGPVIYLSTCSRSLAPGIRIAYLVLPRPLLARWKQRYGLYSSTVSRYEQQTLARFIQQGHFTRHLARMRTEYKRRRDCLTEALYRAFGRNNIRLSGLHTGIHLLLTLHDGPTEEQMVAAARASGVQLAGLSGYFYGQAAHCPPSTVVLGYGTLDAAKVDELSERLKYAWR